MVSNNDGDLDNHDDRYIYIYIHMTIIAMLYIIFQCYYYYYMMHRFKIAITKHI